MGPGEVTQWVDENDVPLGEISRARAHREGFLHRIAVVYVVSEIGDILIQERVSGLLDHSAAGHLNPGESYEEAAKRELLEEIGIKAKNLVWVTDGLSEERAHPGEYIRHMYSVYEVVGTPGTISAREVQSVFWANPFDVYLDMKDDPTDQKYTRAFKDSLSAYLRAKEIL